MKKSFVLKILIIAFTILLISIFPSTRVSASSLSEAIGGADDFINHGIQNQSPAIDEGNLSNMSDMLYNALLVIATVIAVIVGLVIAIQFMTGSVGKRAKVKETLIPYVAGCIVIFGAFGIWKLVVNILSQA